jgi:hypothetical protein
MVRDLAIVEQELGFRYELSGGGHYQDICPRCRRALFGLAQGVLWQRYLNARPPSDSGFGTPGPEPEMDHRRG